VSLDILGQKLSSGRFSSNPDEAEEQRSNFVDCISAATEPILKRAASILKDR